MRNNWWKILACLLLIYTFTAGLLVPLKPGITSVSTNNLSTGTSVQLLIQGYNTSFTNQQHRAYLRISSGHSIKATSLDFQSDMLLEAGFDIPPSLPGGLDYTDATLVVIDGDENYAIYPNIRIAQSSQEYSSESDLNWQESLEVPMVKWKFAYPYRNILVETIRNTFFHVAIWMAMFILLLVALIYSIMYLMKGKSDFDHTASSFTYVAIVFGIIGILTGSVWARYTWGAFWTNDVKLNMVAISLMIYLAYTILRASIDDHDRRAKSSAIYNIFAFCAMIPLIWIIPRLTSSLHPGNGGNPALGGEDLDSTLRIVFYPAIIGLALLGTWISSLLSRIKRIEEKQINILLEDND